MMENKNIWNLTCQAMVLFMVGVLPQLGHAATVTSQARGCDITVIEPTATGHKNLAKGDPPAQVCTGGWYTPSGLPSKSIIEQTENVNKYVDAVVAKKKTASIKLFGRKMNVKAKRALKDSVKDILRKKGKDAVAFWKYKELKTSNTSGGTFGTLKAELNPPPGGEENTSARECYSKAELKQMKARAVQWAEYMQGSFFPKHGIK